MIRYRYNTFDPQIFQNRIGEEIMRNTTLCYIEKDGQYLMLYRIKKKVDVNKGKWIGVGGHCEEGESPDECVIRETHEETGLQLHGAKARGLVTFVSNKWEMEYMHLFTADDFEGELIECDEGELAWIPKNQIMDLPLWEGDKIFLKLLAQDVPYFQLKLEYHDDTLLRATLDGKVIVEI